MKKVVRLALFAASSPLLLIDVLMMVSGVMEHDAVAAGMPGAALAVGAWFLFDTFRSK